MYPPFGSVFYHNCSMLFTGGYDMWKAATLAYAEQLESKRNFHTAVVYYMALGDVYKAIDVFKSNGMYK